MSKTGITRTHPTEAQRKMAIEAYDSGKMSSREIADLIGCHPSWVSKASLDNKRALEAAASLPQPPAALAAIPVNPPGFVHFQTLAEAVAAYIKQTSPPPSLQWTQGMAKVEALAVQVEALHARLDALVTELGGK
jgi:hypothetical protein